jgi:tetratricopeptide (TPR) repeat protein
MISSEVVLTRRAIYPFFCAVLFAQAQSVADLEAQARQRLAARDAAGALADYQKLAALVPKSAVYQDQIGFILAATNRSAEAIPYFERATELDPKMAQAWFHLGVAEWLAKQADPATSALQKAVLLAPGNGDYRFRLGSVYNETGKYEKAASELTHAAKLLPTNAKVWPTNGSININRRATLSGRRCSSIRRTTRLATATQTRWCGPAIRLRGCASFAEFSRAIEATFGCK